MNKRDSQRATVLKAIIHNRRRPEYAPEHYQFLREARMVETDPATNGTRVTDVGRAFLAYIAEREDLPTLTERALAETPVKRCSVLQNSYCVLPEGHKGYHMQTVGSLRYGVDS